MPNSNLRHKRPSLAKSNKRINIELKKIGKEGMKQVFQNLITNGMKFHKKGERPKVEIDCEEEDSRYLFKVKDKGIGIEPAYLNEIFLLFKKLHSENKYKGTGIGLSICMKIIEQHQGDIWVESELGEGSCFYFTVSKDLKINI